MARPLTPFLWTLFSTGGTVAALLYPVHFFLTGLAIPMGWVRDPGYGALHALVLHPLTRLYLFVLVSLPLFHWAHRFRFTLVDLGLNRGRRLVAVVCYGAAVAGTILAALVLIRF